MAGIVDVVEFDLGSERYALDIHLVREIVEMMPITPIPRAPAHITGVINLRGEITNIMNLHTILGLRSKEAEKTQKIIVFMPEAAGGNNVGVIVDSVMSVTPVLEDQVERSNSAIAGGDSQYIKGIIKIDTGDGTGGGKRLVLWLDLEKVLAEVTKQ
ncbi:MAG: purine-binding chemotaxis protein [Methanoregula sp. PtaU1.Bin051]|nr:MAG: purine-binding chemotaxis protein [Methanoregula sp. PtaU1.Bin051]